jgi:hypothetical protein
MVWSVSADVLSSGSPIRAITQVQYPKGCQHRGACKAILSYLTVAENKNQSYLTALNMIINSILERQNSFSIPSKTAVATRFYC